MDKCNVINIEKQNISKRIRYKADSVNINRSYSLPKFLFEGEFKDLSNDARVLYTLLKDKHEYGLNSGWVNEQNEIFLEYGRDEMKDILGVSRPTVVKVVNELKRVGLMEEERAGNRKMNRIYLTATSIDNTMM